MLAEQLQWIDDTRHRGTAADNGNDFASAKMATPPNETASRVEGALFQTANPAASIAIKDYVGWRDHTDGHRITTTRGDKIEVVGGNYKVVSYGRGQGDAVFEMSGGLIVDGDIAPGDVTSVTWRDCPTDSGNKGWKTVEQAQKANQVERFHGTKREEHFGDEIISVIGAPTGLASAAVTATSNNGEAETYLGGGAAAQTKGHPYEFGTRRITNTQFESLPHQVGQAG